MVVLVTSPLVDGTAIVTKQLQQDGTSKITVFKPIEADGKIREVMGHYKHYAIASHAADMGDHRAEIECTNCLECMLEAICDFMCMLEENAGSPEEVQTIKKYRKKIGEM